jgi:hypothetical protein
VPGRHHRLAGIVRDGRGWSVQLREGGVWMAAELGPHSRVFAGFAYLDIRAGGRRHAWLLAREAAAPAPFRRLKAWIRLTC